MSFTATSEQAMLRDTLRSFLADRSPMTSVREVMVTETAYFSVAAENIQIHGGIGFTWEHDAHLCFKRAKSTQLLFGDSVPWRACLADRLGVS